APNYATVATIQPDGQPQLTVVWVKRDGDDILFSTTTNRRKYDNLTRDPRASILIYAQDHPYSYLEVRGTVTTTEEGGRELIDELARKYMGAERYTMDDGTDNVRVVVRISPDKVVFQ
ncbi:MAG: PPOX class F420-dependent oxidoreductase, partial [Actinomycetes bacterium]